MQLTQVMGSMGAMGHGPKTNYSARLLAVCVCLRGRGRGAPLLVRQPLGPERAGGLADQPRGLLGALRRH